MRQHDQGTARRRRTIWSVAAGLLIILAIAQVDERRRYARALALRETWLASKLKAQQSLLGMIESGSIPDKRSDLWARASAPAPFSPVQTGDFSLVNRLRRAVSLGAFAVCVQLLGLWVVGSRDFVRRHERLIAEAMLASALLGTGGMLLGWRYWRYWHDFHPAGDPAGFGLILIPLSLAVLLLVRRRERKIRSGRCVSCDYDLTGNVSGFCPEGGATLAPAQQDDVEKDRGDHQQRRDEAPGAAQA